MFARFFGAALLLGFSSVAVAQETAPKPTPVEKHDASALYYSLRDVINSGAEIFNDQGDYAGCYRMFQGSLLSVKPFLTKDLQSEIEAAIAKAEKMPRFDERAYELRRVLNVIRDQVKPAGLPEQKKVEEPKLPKKVIDEPKKVIDEPKKVVPLPPLPKIIDDTKPEVKTPRPSPPPVDPEKLTDPKKEAGKVSGRVTFQGKSLALGTTDVDYGTRAAPVGYLTFVSNEDNSRTSTAIQKDARYEFKKPVAPGKYRVVVEYAPGQTVPSASDIPAEYRSVEKTPLSIDVVVGEQKVDFDLK